MNLSWIRTTWTSACVQWSPEVILWIHLRMTCAALVTSEASDSSLMKQSSLCCHDLILDDSCQTRNCIGPSPSRQPLYTSRKSITLNTILALQWESTLLVCHFDDEISICPISKLLQSSHYGYLEQRSGENRHWRTSLVGRICNGSVCEWNSPFPGVITATKCVWRH